MSLEFAILVIGVSASGVLAPGPLFAANITYGLAQGARAGIKVAAGHAVVELILIVLLGVGVFTLEALPEFRSVIAISGAVTLFVFAGLQIRSLFSHAKTGNSRHGPFFAGMMLSALNPFFIIWWFGVGLKLISDAMLIWAFGGLFVLFALHVWMDFAWLGASSFLASKCSNIISSRNYKILMIGLSGMLVYFGVEFLTGAGLPAI